MPEGPEVLERRTLRQRVGGRWAVAWQSYLITAVLGLFALLAGEQHAADSAEVFVQWLSLFAVAMGTVGLMVFTVSYTVFRNRRQHPLPVWIVVAFDGLCGVAYSVIMGVGAQRLGLDTDISIVERSLINALSAMWWGPTLSYFLDYRQQLVTTRRDVLMQAVEVELAQAQEEELARRMSEELMKEVNSELIPARNAVDAMLRTLDDVSTSHKTRDTDEWKIAAELLRGTAADSVRPLSRRIWNEVEERHPRERFWNIPLNIVQRQPFRPLAFAVVDVLGTLSQLSRTFGLLDALLLVGVGLALTVTLMLTANFLMRRYPQHHAALFLGTLVALQLTVVVRTQLRENLLPGSAPLSWQVTQIFATIAVVFVTSGFGAWRDKERETLVNLRNDLRHEQVVALARSKQVASVAREMSQVLHGSVQSKLLACAMLLDSDDRRTGQATLNAALAQALDVLTDPMQPREHAESMLDEVNRKIALWDGFCVFEVRVSDAAATSSVTAVVGRVVEEAITNALRHGRASSISIEIDANLDDSFSITIIDNGMGPQGAKPGMGTAYLQQATAGNWSLTVVPQGTKLWAQIGG